MGKNDPLKGSSKYAYKDTTKFPFPSYAKARLCFVCLEKKKKRKLFKRFRCIWYLFTQNPGLSCDEIKANLALLFPFCI